MLSKVVVLFVVIPHDMNWLLQLLLYRNKLNFAVIIARNSDNSYAVF